MVSSTTVDEGETPVTVKPSPGARGISPGNYRLVGWDMDTTGKKLIDEICQIAGYTSSSSFSQYVMPFKNLSPPARKRHSLKIVTVGKYRIMKNSKTNKVLKTKSEISALHDFLTWLETVQGDAKDGVILVHHEPRKVIPSLVLSSLMKYKLLDRFKTTVKGFINGFEVASCKCANTLQAFSLRTLSRVLLNQKEDMELDNATIRARLALQIIQHLSNGEENAPTTEGKGDSEAASEATVEFVREFVEPVESEEDEYEVLKQVLERQFTLKPIFKPLMEITRRERQHATPLRRLLAEAGIDYEQLKNVWASDKMKAMEQLIKDKLTKATDKEKSDLLDILESHFDPEKELEIKLESLDIKKKRSGSKKSRNKENKDKDNNKSVSETESPDTTTMLTPDKIKTESSPATTEDEVTPKKN
ncbi:maternal protein exuperantia isoform X1 [Microplitis mediator]|uniref:maternal protein exuperantia isoform X1 n=1 Tax=Microplitis mediator TaxID=375433 RepID=UPI002552F4BF|nr:maternal protein exuperantia isoform X1 [Microplitis mediator]XP_057323153.1 maternal protein exuperantia isoform X1 [Microplitis mediator]